MKTDIEIAQEYNIIDIERIANKAGIDSQYLEKYGKHKAKVHLNILEQENRNQAKLILVTAINPTPAGEGKTTTTIGLGDALTILGRKTILALREPSLGPVFGIKGGATGGGYAQVVPMEDINLHFTGDFHAIGSANNLLAAIIDNHIQQGNECNIDVRKVIWKRCVDMNDRQLRKIISGLGGANHGVPREDGYDITVASEIMAILCLATSIMDLKERLSKIIVAYTKENKPVTVKDLKVEGALTVLLKDAIQPNLVQTLGQTAVFMHGGPFANIAHGCNSVLATKMAMQFSEYTVTEAGFGADLGAEKFIDIKCRTLDKIPSAVILVATIRALKMHGGINKVALKLENLAALKKGFANLERHISNIKNVYHLPIVVAINKFESDTQKEIDWLIEACNALNVKAFLSTVWENGGKGAIDIAKEVIRICESTEQNNKNKLNFAYPLDIGIIEKIECIAKNIYGAKQVVFMPKAKNEIEKLTQLGFANLPICIAKTQYSFSDNPSLLGAPKNFDFTVKEVKVSAGAGFIVVFTGDIMTMPGLPKEPAAEQIDIDKNGKISGLF